VNSDDFFFLLISAFLQTLLVLRRTRRAVSKTLHVNRRKTAVQFPTSGQTEKELNFM